MDKASLVSPCGITHRTRPLQEQALYDLVNPNRDIARFSEGPGPFLRGEPGPWLLAEKRLGR